jgi:hypothetical protein
MYSRAWVATVDDVDQAAAYATVAVEERVDRLELRVRDRGLQRHGQVVEVEERGEVVEQLLDVLVRRWDYGP